MAKFRGTVRRSDLEGGLWQLHADDGKTYEIDGNDPLLATEGARVEIEGNIDRGALSFGMTGPRLKVRAVPVLPYVELRHMRHSDAAAFFRALEEACAGDADFVDGVVFGAGLVDGTHVVHASVFAGVPATSAPGRTDGGRGTAGRGPAVPGLGARRPLSESGRNGGAPGGGGGIDSR